MKKFQLLLLSIILGWSVFGSAGSVRYHKNNFSISDFNSVPEAVKSIKSILEQQGMEIVGVIDHAANANKVGLNLAATQLILFHDYRLGKKLLKRNLKSGIDLPMKILVYEDSDTGTIKLLYNSAGYLSDRHKRIIKDRFLSHLNKRLSQFGSLENGLVTIDSKLSVKETVKKLKTVLLDNGFFIPFTIDFNKKPYTRKIKPAKLIVFGNPTIGTQLMQNQQSIGLHLPQKFLVWKDKRRKVHITYNDPVFLGKRHGLQGLDTLLGNIANRVGQLANKGAGN